MFLNYQNLFLTAWSLYICSVAPSEGANATLNISAAAESPVFLPATEDDSAAPFILMSAFPDDLEVSDYCSELLSLFGQRYETYVNCLVTSARPVKVCQNCFGAYGMLVNTYMNISSEKLGPGNESCRDSLLRSDRLMLVYLLFNNLKDMWTKSACDNCINDGFQSLTNDTLYFMSTLNQTLTCFDMYQQRNHTELCKNCKSAYKVLNELYSRMEKNDTMCIDIEDGMNVTRRLWSKNFKCSLPREETVPVIAVSAFMLFLPIIFYLSSFLHSEQKKRKLIHPKRAKSYAASLMNIQDKQS
ncbi:osteopetrosis-associated transmembrane protein 1 isoform X1 [Syngnathus acus]|uniref:osteopetrosis-associated transmembrane protein 1 isoform X1 n=2 Tax=Syngnathus acus TaxID=161584 RepID=UPI001885EAC3|nr:osteopetrosis-associated transmembrane protein 1 isoform X1 [Syngnathus acus]